MIYTATGDVNSNRRSLWIYISVAVDVSGLWKIIRHHYGHRTTMYHKMGVNCNKLRAYWFLKQVPGSWWPLGFNLNLLSLVSHEWPLLRTSSGIPSSLTWGTQPKLWNPDLTRPSPNPLVMIRLESTYDGLSEHYWGVARNGILQHFCVGQR